MQQTNAIILKAIALIENPDAWTQGVVARDKKGAPVASDSRRACSWCTIGALNKAIGGDCNAWCAVTAQIRDVIQADTSDITIAQFNDTHTHAEVLALLRKAAA